MTWKERLIGVPLALLGAALLLATGAGMTATRTSWGREMVRQLALERLNSEIRGRLEIDGVVEGDLLRRIGLIGVRVYEPDGRLLATADTVRIEYRWWDFLTRNLVIPEITLIKPVVELEISPEGRWNAIEVFRGAAASPAPDPAVSASTAQGRRIELREVAIRSGDITLRIPWSPDEGTDGRDTRWHIEESDGALKRVYRLERLNARLPIARVLSPQGASRLLQISQMTARATIIGEPIDIEQMRADLELRSDTLVFDLWQGRLPASDLFGGGWVTLGGSSAYDFTLRGNPVNTRDLLWLVPGLPDGTAELDFSMRSLPDGIALEARNARWQSTDAELSGRFAMVLREPASQSALDSVDLAVTRLHTRAIPTLIGWESPIEGELSGQLALNGRLTDLAVDADLRIRPDDSTAASSRVSAVGTVYPIGGSLGASRLELQYDTLELDLVRAFVPGLAPEGRLRGVTQIDGRLSDGLSLYLDIEHHDGARVPTLLRGGGTIVADSGAAPELDITVHTEQVALGTIAAYYPAIPFRGTFRGLMRARGPLTDLDLQAILAGVGDSLLLEGALRLGGDEPSYRAVLSGRRVRLASLREDVPESDIDFRAEFEGTGAHLEDLSADGVLDLSSSFVAGVRFDTAHAILRFSQGYFHADTATVRTEFGEIELAGGLGLQPDLVDTLRFNFVGDSLRTLAPWLFPAFEPQATGFLPDDDIQVGPEPQRPPLEGSVRVQGLAIGSVQRLAIRADAQAEGIKYGEWGADSLLIVGAEIDNALRSLALRAELVAMGAGAGRFRFAEVRGRGAVEERVATIDLEITDPPDVGARGRARIDLGETRTVALETFELKLGSTTWRLVEPSSARLAESGALALDEMRIESRAGTAVLGGSIPAAGPTSLIASLDGLDLREAARLWPDSLNVAGVLGMRAELNGAVEDPVLVSSFEVVDGQLAGVDFSTFRGTVEFQAGEAAIDISMVDEHEHQLFHLYGRFPLDLSLPGFHVAVPERAIHLTLKGDSIPLSLATAFTGAIAAPTGYARVDSLLVWGSPRDISLIGPVALVDGGFRVVATGITYQQLTGYVDFRGDVMTPRDLTLASGKGGRGQLSGQVNISNPANPQFALELDAEELPVYDQLDARAVITGRLQLGGRYDQPILTGDVSVISGVLFIEEFSRRAEIIDPFKRISTFEGTFALFDTIMIGDQSLRPTDNPFIDNMTVDSLSLEVESDTWLRSADANVEIAGDLIVNMQRAEGELSVHGTLQAIRGDYRFFKRFEVVEGTVDFVGTPAMDPNLDIVARHTVQTQKRPIEIRLHVGGTLERPTIELTSDAQPPIPESDLLSYLIFGRPSYELTRTGGQETSLAADVLSSVPQALMGYALGSLLVGETGIAYVDVSQAPRAGADQELAGGFAPALTATQVEVGWYLAPTVFVSVAQQLVAAVQPTVRLEWRLDERLTLQGVTEPRFGSAASLFDAGSGADLEQSLGVFLFYGWNY